MGGAGRGRQGGRRGRIARRSDGTTRRNGRYSRLGRGSCDGPPAGRRGRRTPDQFVPHRRPHRGVARGVGWLTSPRHRRGRSSPLPRCVGVGVGGGVRGAPFRSSPPVDGGASGCRRGAGKACARDRPRAPDPLVPHCRAHRGVARSGRGRRFAVAGVPSRGESAVLRSPARSKLLRPRVPGPVAADHRRCIVEPATAVGLRCMLDPAGGREGAGSWGLGCPASRTDGRRGGTTPCSSRVGRGSAPRTGLFAGSSCRCWWWWWCSWSTFPFLPSSGWRGEWLSLRGWQGVRARPLSSTRPVGATLPWLIEVWHEVVG